MPSAIDATKPADGVAAAKGDLRAALAAAKSELEHCGFFIQAGAGAIERTGADKAREVVSVRDFGASPSASASTNATAFQAAIDATIASGGGRIVVPRASEAYDINATLEIFYRHNNVTTSAPTDGDGVRKLASVWLDGEGGADHDSVFIQDRGSVLNFTGPGSVGLFDLSSDWGARFSRLALVNSGTGSPAQLVRWRSFDSPVASAVGTVYEECYFIDDADNITDALVTLRERKMVTFRQCVWPTGTDALRIGENAGVNSTLMNGSVSGILLHQCTFAGDIRIRAGRAIKFDICEWYPKKGTTAGARIYPDGDLEGENILFDQCKAIFDGDGTGFFYTQGANSRGLVVLGGAFGNYERAFSLGGKGPVLIHGTSFGQVDAGGIDVVLNSDDLFPVQIRADHSRTLAAGNPAVVDNRTQASLPTTANLELAADFTLANNTGFQTPTGMSKPVHIRGGLHRVAFAVTVTVTIDQTIEARIVAPAGLSGVSVAQFVPAGTKANLTLSRLFDLPASTAPVAVSLQVRQSAVSSGTIIRSFGASGGSTWMQVEPV